MPKENIVLTYSFEELPKNIQIGTLDLYRDWNLNSWNTNGWADFVIENEKEDLISYGFESPEIQFSGFCSQGDGASFTADVDLEKWILAVPTYRDKFRIFLNPDMEFNAVIFRKKNAPFCHYSHDKTIEADVTITKDCTEEVGKLADELQDALTEDAQETSRSIYLELEKEYEYLSSDEAIKESFIDNEYQFTAEGKIF